MTIMTSDAINGRNYTLKEARAKVRELLKTNEPFKYVRLIKWETEPHFSILDIADCPTNINRKYSYYSALESFFKDWCREEAYFSIEAVPIKN